MVARGVVPTPDEFDRVRVYLEYEAAQRRPAKTNAPTFFSVSPEVEATLGKAVPGAFDSERGLIGYALAFANGDTAALPESDPRRQPELNDRLFGAETELTRREELRRLLRRFLSILRVDRMAAIRWTTKQMPDIWILPHCERTAKDSVALHFHVLLRSAEALVRFVILLLADGPRGFGRALCQCTFKDDGECKRFFLPSAGRGTPRRLYCTEEHMRMAHEAGSSQRAAASRKKHADAKQSKPKRRRR